MKSPLPAGRGDFLLSISLYLRIPHQHTPRSLGDLDGQLFGQFGAGALQGGIGVREGKLVDGLWIEAAQGDVKAAVGGLSAAEEHGETLAQVGTIELPAAPLAVVQRDGQQRVDVEIVAIDIDAPLGNQKGMPVISPLTGRSSGMKCITSFRAIIVSIVV